MDRTRKQNPSFSSTLLDVIYRSVDDGESVVIKKSTRNRQSVDSCFSQVDKQIVHSLRPSGGSKNAGDVVYRRKSAIDFQKPNDEAKKGGSCSRYRSEFSAEMIYGFPARRPLRTTIDEDDDDFINRSTYDQKHQPEDLKPRANYEGTFMKTKSRAMKIYRHLKTGTDPVSPGGRLRSFLVSLFSVKNVKKSKISSPCTGDHDDVIVHANRKLNSTPISSARSCLNVTPASVKTKVKFYPASVNAIDEHSQPNNHKSINGDRSNSPAVKFAMNSINKMLKMHSAGKNICIKETTRNLLKNDYQKKVEYVIDSINITDRNNNEDDDDDEATSYSSSDLFELDHLSAIGIERSVQELPLYETTSVDANRAIAS
ncbi:hypothetical protein E3N88_21467 [Mikania micrantha]|uniref:Uncharacterized protein n=1 Tax=Mikania micrantha TaxID=192012 RepID=A0A5N6NKB0_9ASTR|nr:hypothetical protein E3N88_21467 [Mikania micrantha]